MTSKLRLLRIVPCIAAIGAIACAGQDPVDQDPTIENGDLWVSAQPLGGTFDDGVTVRLLSERPSKMYYTLDGSPPTGATAVEYLEPLAFERDALLMFVAVDENGVWSKPQSELYRKNDSIGMLDDLERALSFDKTLLFFTPKPGTDYVEHAIEIESTGLNRVRIPRVSIGPNFDASSFFRPDAFQIMNAPSEVVVLAPGEKLSIMVRYFTTETIRSSALVIQSDDLRAKDGEHRIALWGRLEP